MLIVLFQWLLFFVVFWSLGHLITLAINWQEKSISKKLLGGLVLLTFDQVVLSFFFPTATIGLFATLLVSIILLVIYWTDFLKDLQQIKPKLSKYFLTIVLITAWISSQSSTIFDNNSYYLPTMQWFGEYGTVKGIANLHPFLAQSSIWHVLQSTFSFSFLGSFYDDLNGFLILVGVFYFIERHPNNLFRHYYFCLPVLLLFVDSCSPDLPILVMTPIIFYSFLDKKFDTFYLILIFYLVFIKVIIAPLLLLVLFNTKLFKKWKYWFPVGFAMLLIWGLKNYFVSGYILYPLQIEWLSPDWMMSPDILKFVVNETINAGYSEQTINVIDKSFWERIMIWIKMGGINGLFNKTILLLFLIYPIVFFRKSNGFIKLYFVLLTMFLFVLFTSPQYRFFLAIWLFFVVSLIDLLFSKKHILKPIANVGLVILCLIIMFVDMKTIDLRSKLNPMLMFHPNTTVYNEQNFKKIETESLQYFSPIEYKNFFETNYTPLPSSNKDMLTYFEKKIGVYPVMKDPKDIRAGFKHQIKKPISINPKQLTE